MELFQASRQWANRPADQRFESLASLYEACHGYATQAQEKRVAIPELRAVRASNEVCLISKAGNEAAMTHYAFGQVCSQVGAPAGYLRELPAQLAAENLNHGLQAISDRDPRNLLFHANGRLVLRAFTSDRYTRIWNWEVAKRLLVLEERGWTPAIPDKRFDGGNPKECQRCDGTGKTGSDGVHRRSSLNESQNCSTCNGTGRAFPALYASDHDMFAFVRNNSCVIREPGNPDGLQRGVIVSNSEVGAAALKMTRFLYREMCGNHIIWGASKVLDISVRHVGDAHNRWSGYAAELKRYAETSASDDEAKIASAKTVRIGDTKEQVLDKLFGMRSINLPMKTLEAGYQACRDDVDGSPKTPWGIVQGLTRHSQTVPYADQRTDIDRAAGKIMEANF